MAMSQRRCRVEKVKGGGSRQPQSVSKLHAVAKMSQTHRKLHFSLIYQRNIVFLEMLPDHLQSSFTLILPRRMTSVLHAEDGGLRRFDTHTKMATNETTCFFFPGQATTVEKLQVFRDLFCLFVLVHWLCPRCIRHFSCVFTQQRQFT